LHGPSFVHIIMAVGTKYTETQNTQNLDNNEQNTRHTNNPNHTRCRVYLSPFRNRPYHRLHVYAVIIKLARDASRRARFRMRRHGDDVELVFEEFIGSKSAPFGLLFKSNKTEKYIWYDRKQLEPIDFYDGDKVPSFVDGVDIYTPNKELLYEYLDHLISNVLSKRDQKRFGLIYDSIRDDQLSLIDRLSA